MSPGLFFIGEVVDVTGWLGGYNFQWAWASGHAAGQFASRSLANTDVPHSSHSSHQSHSRMATSPRAR